MPPVSYDEYFLYLLADAIKTMRTKMFTINNGDRLDVPNFALFITNHVGENIARSLLEARLAREAGTHVYTLGIGLRDTRELAGIASAPLSDNIFTVRNYEELHGLAVTLSSRLCTGKCYGKNKTKKNQFQFLCRH